MAPTSKAPLVKWTQEEVDVLVEITNDQLKLEAQDKSTVISWSSHWKRVSSRLRELGYNRTPTACRSIWRRGVAEQQVNHEAAGPEWDDSEHEILVHMTKKQLDMERADKSNVISWAKHWKNVSLQLDESGYVRTPDNCEAYWLLVENSIFGDDASGVGDDTLDDAEIDQSPAANDGPDEKCGPLAVNSPQTSTKTPSIWSLDEYENLMRLLKERRQFEAENGLEMLTGSKLWITIAQLHNASGYHRNFEGCKTFWSKHGRQRSGYDERVKLSPSISNPTATSNTNPVTESSAQSTIQPVAVSSTTNSSMNSTASSSANGDRSKTSSLSSLWSPVNEAEAEESLVVSRNPAIDVLKKYQKEHSSQHSSNDHVTSDLNSSLPTLVDPVVIDEPEQDHKEAQGKREDSVKSAIPMQSADPERGSSTTKGGLTSFRFTPEQRAVLEAEASKTGGTLAGLRRAELAEELGVEEKTVRNWFNNYNVKARRSKGSTPSAPAFRDKGFDDDFNSESMSKPEGHAPSVASPKMLSTSIADFSGVTPKRLYPDDGTPEHRPTKKTRLEVEVEGFKANQGFNAVNGHPNRQISQGSSIAASGLRSVYVVSASPTEARGPSGNASQWTNRLSNGICSTPSRVIQSSGFTAISKNPTETLKQTPIPVPPNLQLKSTPAEPTPRPENHEKVPPVAEQHPPAPNHTGTAYPGMLCENDSANLQTGNSSTNTNTAQNGATQPAEKKAYSPHVWSKEPKDSKAGTKRQPKQQSNHGETIDPGDRNGARPQPLKEPKASNTATEPQSHPQLDREVTDIEAGTASRPRPLEVQPLAKSHPVAVAVPSHTSPNRESAKQPITKNEEPKDNSTNLKPVRTPLPSAYTFTTTPVVSTHSNVSERPTATPAPNLKPVSILLPTTHTHTDTPVTNQQDHSYEQPIATPTPYMTPDARLRTASTPSDENPKVTAIQQVEKFRSEIHNLGQINAAHTTRIRSLEQQISTYSNQHNELNAAKDAEVAQVLSEIVQRYEGLHMGLRQQEEWLEKEKEIEVASMKKNMLELSKKQKGLVRWQGIVEYYDTEGDEEL